MKVLIMIFGFGNDTEVIHIKDMSEVSYWYNRRIEKASQMFVCDEECELDCGPYQDAYNKREAKIEKDLKDEADRREFERLKKKFASGEY